MCSIAGLNYLSENKVLICFEARAVSQMGVLKQFDQRWISDVTTQFGFRRYVGGGLFFHFQADVIQVSLGRALTFVFQRQLVSVKYDMFSCHHKIINDVNRLSFHNIFFFQSTAIQF